MMRKDRRGQVTAEIAVLFTFVIAALVFMGTYLQRGSRGSVKGNVDSIGQQFSTQSGWKSISRSKQHQTDTLVGGTVTNKVKSSQCSDYEHVVGGRTLSGGGVGCTAPDPEIGFVDP